MDTVFNFAKLELAALLLTLLAVVLYQMLTGRINTRGMLNDKATGKLSPGRVQLLFFTMFGGLYFLFKVIDNPAQFPEIPPEMLYLLGGSNAAYLGGKLMAFWNKINQPKPE